MLKYIALSNDLYKTTVGNMEQLFEKHNFYALNYYDYDNLTALPFHLAAEMVEKNIWEDQKKKYFVILPNNRWKVRVPSKSKV